MFSEFLINLQSECGPTERRFQSTVALSQNGHEKTRCYPFLVGYLFPGYCFRGINRVYFGDTFPTSANPSTSNRSDGIILVDQLCSTVRVDAVISRRERRTTTRCSHIEPLANLPEVCLVT